MKKEVESIIDKLQIGGEVKILVTKFLTSQEIMTFRKKDMDTIEVITGKTSKIMSIPESKFLLSFGESIELLRKDE